MKKLWVIICISSVVAGFRTAIVNNKPADIKQAVDKSLDLLQKSSHTFLENAGGCHSCHGQGLGGVAFSMARENGFTIRGEILQEAMDSIHNNWQSRIALLAQNDDPIAIVMSGAYDLWALTATQYPRSKMIELLARNIMRRQNKNGSWVSPNMRPPLEYYSFTATALTVKNSLYFLPAVLKEEVTQRVNKAKVWMMNNPVETNEERAFQLLGLTWADGDKVFIKQQAKKLLATQHSNGGWSQLDSLAPDAYATGQSLYALYQCKELQPSTEAYQAGVRFLLETQEEDGSWQVKTRSFPSVPYVDSGFPHKDDQFISAAGSNWATMALIIAAGNSKN